METSMEGAVFVQTNAAHNEVIAFARGTDGMLTHAGTFATGGAGNDAAHLPSQGSVTLTRDRRHLLVTNVASNDVSVFSIEGAMVALTKTIPAGAASRSVAEHDGLVFVLATGDARINGFRLLDGDLVPIEGASMALSTPDGAQVGFTPDGRALIVTERGGDKLSSFAVGTDGSLGTPRTIDSQGATPYGFAISSNGTIVVTEAFRAEKGAAAASSYRVDGDSIAPVTASIGNGRSEICWAVISNDGRYAFTTNFADGAIRATRSTPTAASCSRTRWRG
ncbi:MAG: lactonase family protein [Actinomycetota bacterium]|nr:lactonase family protein [Actinomycetota bacterium]